ncbi:MAG: FkbM family methyltransferase [Bacteroidota bacterium]
MKILIQKFFSFFGYTIIKTRFFQEAFKPKNFDQSIFNQKKDLIANVFQLFKDLGFKPIHIMDVGANHGSWAREVKSIFVDSNFTLIEPQASLSDSFSDLLTSAKFEFLNIGVGDKPGYFNFTIEKRDDSSNFRMTEQEALESGLKQIKVEVDTIDNIVKKSKFGFPDILKIDAEGLDIEVLKGAKTILGKTEVVLVEAAVVNFLFNNNVLNVLNFMDQHGYKLFDITDMNRPLKKNVLWLVELVFIRKNGFFSKVDWLN